MTVIVSVAAPAFAATAGQPCPPQKNKTPLISKLGVSHPFTKPFKTIPDLQKRLPEIEADLRASMAMAGMDKDTADAVIAAMASGYGLVDRPLKSGEKIPLQWMAYRCKGMPGVVTTPTLRLDRKSEAFELIVEVPDPPPPPPFPGICEISATRNCEHENPTIAIDIDGSKHEPQVSMAAEGETAVPVQVSGTSFSVSDPDPYCKKYTLTVTAHGDPKPPRYARVFQFLMPKACGNLALVKELDKKMIEPPGPPPTCKKDATVEMCAPWCVPSVEPSEIEVHHEVQLGMTGGWCDDKAKLSVAGPEHAAPLAVEQPPFSAAYKPLVPTKDCLPPYDVVCQAWNAAGVETKETAELVVLPHDWIGRGFLFYLSPSGDEQKRDLVTTQGAGREEYEIDDGLGIGVAFERKLNKVIGLEFAALAGKVDTEYTLNIGTQSGSDSHPANFYAFTFGPNFHLTPCAACNLYLGPFVGYGGLADPNYWALGHHFAAELSGDFVYGAQLGLDVPFDPTKDLGFHAGLRYMIMEQESDMGKFDVDPLIFEAGLSWKF